MDLEVIESGNGGDLLKRGNDLGMVLSFENMPYLALWGGNKEASTPVNRLANEQDFSFWGNAFITDPGIQFNSLTERTLHSTALTSAGRLIIEEAIRKDLQFMRPFAEITVSTAIIAPDHLRIAIKIKEPGNLEEKEFIYIWDAAKLSLLEDDYTPNPNPLTDEALQYESGFYL